MQCKHPLALGRGGGHLQRNTGDIFMPSGLVALLDDMAVIAKAASASMDDVAVAAGKAGTKTAGVVIDDAAVTPGYVTGLSPARELPIIWKIAKGSLKNKLLFLLPGALLLSEFLPGAIIWLLMLGGAFLCYEGAEKVMEKLGAAKHGKTLEDEITDPVAFENQRVAGAIRTDMILSAEIMAIALAEVATETLVMRGAVLAIVGIVVTVAVYGAVALIVKMDDVGLHLTTKPDAFSQGTGRFLLRLMPQLLIVLSLVGTIAMLWVGGGIIVHGTHEVGFHAIYDVIHGAEYAVAGASGAAGGVLGWLTYAALSAVVGLILGSVIALVLHKVLGVGAGEEH
jgi:predicted DNA repair protein MutK